VSASSSVLAPLPPREIAHGLPRMSEPAPNAPNVTPTQPDLYLGLLAVRNEFVNLSELKHCLEVRRKQQEKVGKAPDLGDVLVAQRYLTPQDLEYLHMIRLAESNTAGKEITLQHIEEEFQSHLNEIKPGATFGHFAIEEEIGRGGMGIVFRCKNKDNDTEAALKVLIGRDQAAVRDIERFKKEATVMMPLDHNSIVKIYEVSREKGLDFIAMEYVPGKNLKDIVASEGGVDAARALRIIRSAAEAVQFIHAQGIIHRDIKPENIMVRPDGTAVLMDFGLAGWDKIEVLAGRGSIGTPMYQPPEQADVNGPFGKISEASDVYGLGATLYFMLTARHPFLGKSVKEVRDKIKTIPPDPPRSVNPKIPQVAEAICLRCLKKRQNERFLKPKDLIEAIDQVLTILDPHGTATGAKPAKMKTGILRRGTQVGMRPANQALAKKKSDPAHKAARAATKSSPELKAVPAGADGSSGSSEAVPAKVVAKRGPRRPTASGAGGRAPDVGGNSGGMGVVVMVVIALLLLVLLGVGVAMVLK
jgi:serine/threonine protein kinase